MGETKDMSRWSAVEHAHEAERLINEASTRKGYEERKVLAALAQSQALLALFWQREEGR